jgi:hypothetical protein
MTSNQRKWLNVLCAGGLLVPLLIGVTVLGQYIVDTVAIWNRHFTFALIFFLVVWFLVGLVWAFSKLGGR